MVEHPTTNREVAGSSPVMIEFFVTIKNKK